MTRSGPDASPLTRRVVLTLGASALSLTALRRGAWADTTAAAEVAKILNGRTAKPGGITLDVPSIAENGLVVPLVIDAASPMTEADHITAVHIVADGNPNPLVASFRFTPACGKASASTRIRLAQTQNVIAFAETSSGDVHSVQAEVKVTIGGCGG